jgi:hypothetical protein
VIESKEHFYEDDPNDGPADVKTRLRDVQYFLLGNGRIQAAIQFAPAGEGTPLGLLIMDPDVLGKKREALTMDREQGLLPTMVGIRAGADVFLPSAGALSVRRDSRDGIPSVRAEWPAGSFQVEEAFWCPDPARPVLAREIKLVHRGTGRAPAGVLAGTGAEAEEKTAVLDPGGEASRILLYELDAAERRVRRSWADRPPDSAPAAEHGRGLARASFGRPLLDRFFEAAKAQLPAAVSRSGCVDGSIWQYNREWVRDQAVMAAALAMIGEREKAATMFDRLLERFITAEGDAMDSSERRSADEVELDQNGFLLHGLRAYVAWTGDRDILRRRWDKIAAAAEFPLREEFRHPASGLLMNRREFWERHRIHGIETGLELIYQVYAVFGLEAAAELARLVGAGAEAGRWESEGRRIKKALLEDPVFRMADNRGFLKRRTAEGPVQETIQPGPEAQLPASVPLASDSGHFLNPDAGAALPVALGLVPPDSPLARLTMASMETLWNQAWTIGGYGRYHVSSEPDSPGPWPFASLFIARAAVETGDFENVWRILNWMDSVPGAAAGSWFEFYGPRPSPPFPQVGIIPWTWAEIIWLLVHHVLGLRPQADGLRIRPRLLPGLTPVRAEFAVGGVRLRLEIEASAASGRLALETDGRVLARGRDDFLLAAPDRDLRVTLR